jgi:hypothetical protein
MFSLFVFDSAKRKWLAGKMKEEGEASAGIDHDNLCLTLQYHVYLRSGNVPLVGTSSETVNHQIHIKQVFSSIFSSQATASSLTVICDST